MATSRSVRLHRMRRLVASGSPLLFAGGVAIAGLAVSGISKGLNLDHIAVWVLFVLWIALLLLQMNAEYRRRTFDPTWLVKFSDEFHSDELFPTRCKASQFLKKNVGQLADKRSSDLDSLFDFLEQVGFLLQGDQITAESAHHAFHHWIRGYWCAAQDYVAAARAAEPSIWEFVEVLFDMTDQIEQERCKNARKHVKLLDKTGIVDFLDEEIDATCLSPRCGAESGSRRT